MKSPASRGISISNMQKQWKLKQTAASTVAALASATGLSPVTASILSGRGLTEPEQVASFLNPTLAAMLDPFLMAGMEQAVVRLVAARAAKEPVCIYGDYDVDGISATALLVSGFTAMGLTTGYHIPNRMEDGYGLNADALRLIKERGAGIAVSVDCGVTAIEEARISRSIGLDLIITDHHQLLDQLPDAVAVINPHRSDCSYPFKGLAGVGVAFNLLVALRSRLRDQGAFDGNGPDLRQWLDLVALGTIADLVPLVDQNRLLTAAGLQRMGEGSRIGLAALKQVAGIKGEVSSGQVGFQLAPRLNAVGRLESAVPGVELLLSEDPQQAAALAAELDGANLERRQVERRIFDEAIAQIEAQGGLQDRNSIVLSSPDWHQGVVGIVASRLVERYYRPTLLVAERDDASGKGSGRSISGFHLLEALHECADFLQRYGGHRAAAGVTVEPGQMAAFADAFEQAALTRLGDQELIPELVLDVEVAPRDLTSALVAELQRLGPFGMGNATPVLLLRQMQVLDCRSFGEGHLNLRLQRDGLQFKAVGWGMAERTVPALVDLACTVRLETWNGREQLKLELKDFRSSEDYHAA
ncbi:single-stranded-DNA-specific exonuclease RecJ [Trichlorobacter lovleyi]|nr:single-stranded-DNA-specific exonuclease RecJ [Trichlorobacter lovleyi]